MAMKLEELYEAYKAKKLAFEQAKKEEDKYKKLLKDAMEEATCLSGLCRRERALMRRGCYRNSMIAN